MKYKTGEDYKRQINRMLDFDDGNQNTSTGFVNVGRNENDPNKTFAEYLSKHKKVDVGDYGDGSYNVCVESDCDDNLGYSYSFDDIFDPELEEGTFYEWFREKTENFDVVERADDVWYEGGLDDDFSGFDEGAYAVVTANFERIKGIMEELVKNYKGK